MDEWTVTNMSSRISMVRVWFHDDWNLESSYGPATKQTEETGIRYRQPWKFGQCVTMNYRYSIHHQGAIIICHVDPARVRECMLPGPFVLQLSPTFVVRTVKPSVRFQTTIQSCHFTRQPFHWMEQQDTTILI